MNKLLLTQSDKNAISELFKPIGVNIEESKNNKDNYLVFTITAPSNAAKLSLQNVDQEKLKQKIIDIILAKEKYSDLTKDNILIELAEGSIIVHVTIIDESNVHASMMKTLRDILEMYKQISQSAIENSEYDAKKFMRDIQLFEEMSKIYERKQGREDNNVQFIQNNFLLYLIKE